VRDITERQRGMDLILWQYENTVLPAARKYLLPSKVFANLVVESKSDLPTVEKNVYEAIVEKRAGNS
jgi:uridine kinase